MCLQLLHHVEKRVLHELDRRVLKACQRLQGLRVLEAVLRVLRVEEGFMELLGSLFTRAYMGLIGS